MVMIVHRSKSKALHVLHHLPRPRSRHNEASTPTTPSKPALPHQPIPLVTIEAAESPGCSQWLLVDSSRKKHDSTTHAPDAQKPTTNARDDAAPSSIKTAVDDRPAVFQQPPWEEEDTSRSHAGYEPVRTKIRTWGDSEAVFLHHGGDGVDENGVPKFTI